MLRNTYRRRLHERALEQYGYVTTRDAAEIGVPPVELRKLAERGGLEHVARGLFRFDDVPVTGRDGYMEAVLRVGADAFLAADAVLALHDLALVNPRRIRVGTPARVRAELPPTVEVVQQRVPPEKLTVYEGIPTTTIGQALLDSRGLVMRERLIDAAEEAMDRGLLRKREGEHVLSQLQAT